MVFGASSIAGRPSGLLRRLLHPHQDSGEFFVVTSGLRVGWDVAMSGVPGRRWCFVFSARRRIHEFGNSGGFVFLEFELDDDAWLFRLAARFLSAVSSARLGWTKNISSSNNDYVTIDQIVMCVMLFFCNVEV